MVKNVFTPMMTGRFNCKAYDQTGKLTFDQRKMLADTDNISFGVIFPINKVPECFMVNGKLDEFCTPKASKAERERAQAEGREAVADVVTVRFKIGANCKWHGADEQPIARPTNAELDANRWNAVIAFTRKEKVAGKPLSPSGYWANGIMVEKVDENMFVGKGFATPAAPSAPATVDPTADPDNDGDLPF